MKTKSTKRALVSSVVALMICFVMLLGTTFAWFTDNVTSQGNIIKTGTLDVEMYWAKGTEDPAAANWIDASKGSTFNNDKWEPGYAEARHIKIENKGTLALAYKLAIIPHGEVSKLADVIDVYYVAGATQVNGRADLDSHYIGSLRSLINNGIASGMLEEAAKYDATIVLKMQETAGNEYQNLSIGSDFSIQLIATQVTSESDSFGTDYDKNAFTTVNSVEALRAAINSAVDTTTIFVQAGTYEINPVINVSDKEITIVGLGVVNFVKVGGSHIMNVADNSVVTIKNINMDGNGLAREGVYVRNNTTVNLVNCYIKNTGGKDVMIDEASDALHGLTTTSTVNLVNSHIEDVAMCASPVNVASLADATQDTYAKFNFDGESSVYSVEVQDICNKPENCYVNGSNIHDSYTFYVFDDATLAKALAEIKTNSKCWNADVTVVLAAGEYSGDHVINQYPGWNGIPGRNTGEL